MVRCDVTLYEEQLPYKAEEKSVAAISDAEVLIIGGTSLTVYPAASYVCYFRGKHIVIVNHSYLKSRAS